MKQSFARIAVCSAVSLLALSGAQAAEVEPKIDYDNPPPVDDAGYNGKFRPIGEVIRLAPEFDKLVPADAGIELLANGFNWAEGPVYVWRRGSVLFSDVPENKIYEWKQGKGLSVFMEPSGYTADVPRGGEMGSNGLTLDSNGRLVIAQHGNRAVTRVLENGKTRPIVRYYKWRRFNSPNDLVFHSNGDLYFTDPPYGLANREARELPFNGVYRVNPDGDLTLLDDGLSRPNGIAFSPDESTLYVAVSDPADAKIYAYTVKDDGTVDPKKKRVFFDATALMRAGGRGLPDGLKVDVDGNVWSTGPGGVLVISPEGKHLGTISPGETTANCAWGDDGSVLYMTSDSILCRIRTSTMGVGPGFSN